MVMPSRTLPGATSPFFGKHLIPSRLTDGCLDYKWPSARLGYPSFLGLPTWRHLPVVVLLLGLLQSLSTALEAALRWLCLRKESVEIPQETLVFRDICLSQKWGKKNRFLGKKASFLLLLFSLKFISPMNQPEFGHKMGTSGPEGVARHGHGCHHALAPAPALGHGRKTG